MNFEELSATIEKHRKRVALNKYVEAQRELSGETYPLLSMIVEAVGERLDEIEGQLVGLIENSLSIVQPDLATQILAVFNLAAGLADAVENDGDAKALVPALREAIKSAEEEVLESVVEEEEEGEEEEEVEEVAPVPAVVPVAAQPAAPVQENK